MAVMKASQFIQKLKDIAKNYKTLYVMGCFGAPMTAANKKRYTTNHAYNRQAARTAMINAASSDTFGFDCVCLIKGVLWGWSGNENKTYGGASYAINGVPDLDADTMITRCAGVSTTGWANMVPGEAVWMSGHIGVYIGEGLAVECTPSWANKVQITAVGNIGSKAGYQTRTWTKHGKLPYIEYDTSASTSPSTPSGSGTTTSLKYKVGDEVQFTGTTHYTSTNAASGTSCKPGVAKVTQVYATGKHPYHLVAVSGKGSTVYGWVDAADISGESATLAVGARVKVRTGANTYNGDSLASFVYKTTYQVIQIDGDRVVIGLNGAVTAAVKSSDLIIM